MSLDPVAHPTAWHRLDAWLARLRPHRRGLALTIDAATVLLCWNATYLFRLGFERWFRARPDYDPWVIAGIVVAYAAAFLLLRVGPLLEQSVLLQILIVAIGSITAVYAAITCKVQSDVKSGLAFASLLQVSIIVVEIGLGLRYIALMHIIGHASMRTLQLLRAPSLLRDFRGMENDLGHTITHLADAKQTPSPATFRLWCYRFALERGSLDTLLDERVAQPVIRVFRWLDAWERRWVLLLTGRKSPLETDVVEETETP